MVTVGSKVITMDGKEGVVLAVDGRFAHVIIGNRLEWMPIEQLEDTSMRLIDRMISNELDDPLEFILAMDAYRLLNEYKFNPYVLASSTKIFIFPHQIDEVTKIIEEPRNVPPQSISLIPDRLQRL